MKIHILILLLFFFQIANSQISNNVNIVIEDTLYKIKSFAIKKSLNDHRVYFLPKYNKKLKVKVKLKNNSDSIVYLYYLYNNVFSNSLRYTAFKNDTLIATNQSLFFDAVYNEFTKYVCSLNIPRDSIITKSYLFHDFVVGKYENFLGIRYVLLDSNKNETIPFTTGRKCERWSFFEKLAYFQKEFIYKVVSVFYNKKNPRFSKPLILKAHEEKTINLNICLLRKVNNHGIFGRPEDIFHPMDLKINKGIYYIFLYYWVNFSNTIISPNEIYIDYVNYIYNVKTRHAHQYYILKDINRRKKGIPFEGYIKSNTIKVIVE